MFDDRNTTDPKTVAKPAKAPTHMATTNACKLCTPLGATMVFHGLEGGMCLLHGSQGCSTYIRRYLISHFKEPLDIASSNFSEQSAVYGGWDNLRMAIENLERAYQPAIVGVATTCLAETMGEDVPDMLRRIQAQWAKEGGKHPILIHVSTPSYKGTHAEGFQAALKAVVEQLVDTGVDEPAVAPDAARAGKTPVGYVDQHSAIAHGDFDHKGRKVVGFTDGLNAHGVETGASAGNSGRQFRTVHPSVNLFPGMASPSDLRELRELAGAFGLASNMPGDYSDTLDGGVWDDYHALPPGGTPLAEIQRTPDALLSLELGGSLAARLDTASAWLEDMHGVPRVSLGWPVGVDATDRLMEAFISASGQDMPVRQIKSRARLVDAYADAHKVVFGQKVVIYGEADLALSMALFAREIGMVPVLVGTGARQASDRLGREIPSLETILRRAMPDFDELGIKVLEGADFIDLELAAREIKPDLIIGHSKGFKMSRSLGIPLVRLGFPIHDRFGGARMGIFGYEGSLDLFDKVVNAILDKRQSDNPVGYTYY